MPHSNDLNKWKCPVCKKENNKYISNSTVVDCKGCRSLLSWNGEKIVLYHVWLDMNKTIPLKC